MSEPSSTSVPGGSAKPWMPLAARAFAAQRRGDTEVAARLVQRISVEHDAIIPAMVAWIDTVLIRGFGVTEFNENGAGVIFVNDDGEYKFADGSQPPEVVWSGRLLAARACGDQDTFNALINVISGEDSTEASWTRHVFAVLSCAALTFNAIQEPAA